MRAGWLARFLRRDRIHLPPISQLSQGSVMPRPSSPRDDTPAPAEPAAGDRPDCHTRGPGLDPVALNEVKLEFLQDQAQRADERIGQLNQELLMHRGGGQHLGHVIGLVEAHRARLGDQSKAQGGAGAPLEGQALAEHQAQVAGVVDALALLRSQGKTADLAAQRAEAALLEMSRHRSDLSLQGKAQAGKVGQLMAEMAAGVPREMVGRPKDAAEVRKQVDDAKDAERTIVGKRKSVRLA